MKKIGWNVSTKGGEWGIEKVRILGPEDFDGYERNYPGSGWELIGPIAGTWKTVRDGEFINLKRCWSARVFKTKKEALAYMKGRK